MILLKYITWKVAAVYIASFIHAQFQTADVKAKMCTIFNPTTELFRYFSIFSISAYLTGWLICVNRLVLCEVADKGLGIITAYHGSSALMIVSLVGAIYSVMSGSQFKCEDFAGVTTELGFYSDWIASLLIMVMVILFIDEKLLNFKSYSCLIGCVMTTTLCMSAQAYLPNNIIYRTLYIITIGLVGLTSYVTSYTVAFKIIRNNQELLIKARVTGVPIKQVGSTTTPQLIAEQILKVHKFGQLQKYIFILTRQQILLIYFSIIWTVFPVMYCLQLFFSSDHYDEVFMIIWKFLSIVIKLAFTGICIDSYLEISHPLSSFITREQFSNESRRYFLGYIFHEVYTPLLAISEGIQYLQKLQVSNKPKVIEPEGADDSTILTNETYFMMNDATYSIGETLNDAMTLLKIEEGQMKLVTNTFTIPEIFSILQKRFASMLCDKAMRLQMEIPSELQHTIFVGDNIRLIHVLSNIVLNAVQYSYHNSIIQLVAKAECDPYSPTKSAREKNSSYDPSGLHQDSTIQRDGHTYQPSQPAINRPLSSNAWLRRLYSSITRIPSIKSVWDFMQSTSNNSISQQQDTHTNDRNKKKYHHSSRMYYHHSEEDTMDTLDNSKWITQEYEFQQQEEEESMYQLQNINFSVIDYGTGIAKKDQQSDIFQPFRILKCNPEESSNSNSSSNTNGAYSSGNNNRNPSVTNRTVNATAASHKLVASQLCSPSGKFNPVIEQPTLPEDHLQSFSCACGDNMSGKYLSYPSLRLRSTSSLTSTPTHAHDKRIHHPKSVYEQESDHVNLQQQQQPPDHVRTSSFASNTTAETTTTATTAAAVSSGSSSYLPPFSSITSPHHQEDIVGNGHGLGLAICKEIIKLLNGYIYYDSIEGEGTTFHVLLPLRIHEHSPSSMTTPKTPEDPSRIRSKSFLQFMTGNYSNSNNQSDEGNTSPVSSGRMEEMCYVFPSTVEEENTVISSARGNDEKKKTSNVLLQQPSCSSSSDSTEDCHNNKISIHNTSNDDDDVTDDVLAIPSAEIGDCGLVLPKTLSYVSFFSSVGVSSCNHSNSNSRSRSRKSSEDFCMVDDLLSHTEEESRRRNPINNIKDINDINNDKIPHKTIKQTPIVPWIEGFEACIAGVVAPTSTATTANTTAVNTTGNIPSSPMSTDRSYHSKQQQQQQYGGGVAGKPTSMMMINDDYFLHSLSSTRSHIDILFNEHTSRCRTKVIPPVSVSATPQSSATSSPLITSSKSAAVLNTSIQPFLSATTAGVAAAVAVAAKHNIQRASSSECSPLLYTHAEEESSQKKEAVVGGKKMYYASPPPPTTTTSSDMNSIRRLRRCHSEKLNRKVSSSSSTTSFSSSSGTDTFSLHYQHSLPLNIVTATAAAGTITDATAAAITANSTTITAAVAPVAATGSSSSSSSSYLHQARSMRGKLLSLEQTNTEE